jgi:hypothetical protein
MSKHKKVLTSILGGLLSLVDEGALESGQAESFRQAIREFSQALRMKDIRRAEKAAVKIAKLFLRK